MANWWCWRLGKAPFERLRRRAGSGFGEASDLWFNPEIAAPLSFGAMLGGFAPQDLPGSFLSSASANAEPDVFGSQRLLDAMLSGGK